MQNYTWILKNLIKIKLQLLWLQPHVFSGAGKEKACVKGDCYIFWAPFWPSSHKFIPFRNISTSRVSSWVPFHIPQMSKSTLGDYADIRSWFILTEQSRICHKVIPAIPHDSTKILITKDINSPLRVGVHIYGVGQGVPSTGKSEFLYVCTGNDNARYSCWESP